MPVTIDNIVVFSLGGVAGYLVRTLIDHFLAKSRTREDREAKRFEDAATSFRSKVLAELEGIYPITRPWWDESVLPRFQQSISKVETAAAEFRHFIKRKPEFDNAVKEYREYCQKRIYERASAWSMYPDMHTPDDIGPAETFKNIVEHLFSFTERK